MFIEDSQSQSDLILTLEGSLNFTHWSALQADDLAWIKKGRLMYCIIILITFAAKSVEIMDWNKQNSGHSLQCPSGECSLPHRFFLRALMDTYLNTLYQSVLASSLFFADECRGVNIKGEDADRISKLVKKTRLCWRAEPVHPEGCELNWTPSQTTWGARSSTRLCFNSTDFLFHFLHLWHFNYVCVAYRIFFSLHWFTDTFQKCQKQCSYMEMQPSNLVCWIVPNISSSSLFSFLC